MSQRWHRTLTHVATHLGEWTRDHDLVPTHPFEERDRREMLCPRNRSGITLDGWPVLVTTCALRITLNSNIFSKENNEFLQLNDDDSVKNWIDIMDDDTWNKIHDRAEMNSKIYWDVFRCLPSNNIHRGLIEKNAHTFLKGFVQRERKKGGSNIKQVKADAFRMHWDHLRVKRIETSMMMHHQPWNNFEHR